MSLPDTSAGERLLSKHDVGQRLGGLSLSTVERIITRGELPCVRIGRRVLIAAADLDAYIERARIAG